MMKGSDIGIQDKNAKLFNEWERFTSNDGESIESYYHRFLKLMNDLKRNKHFLEKIANYTQLYDFLKYNQKEVDELKPKRLAKTQDPLARMANSNNPYAFPAPHQDQPSFNQNYMQQPMPNPEDITDLTTAMNMALALMAKAFKLNYSTPTNNNQRISSNPRNLNGYNAVQNVGNQVAQNAIQNPRIQNVVQGNANQNLNGNGTLVAARAKCNSTGHNGIQLQAEEFDLMVAAADLDEIEEYTELLEPIPESHQVPQNDNNVISEKSVYQEHCLSKKINALHLSFGKQIMTLNEEILDLNKQLSKEKSTVSFLLKEKKRLKSDFKICEDELIDKQIQLEKRIKELDNILVKTGQSIQTIHMLSPKPDSFYHTKKIMALGYQNPFYLKQAQKKQQSLYDEKVLLEKHDPPVVHDSEETLQLAQESRQKMKQLNKEIKPANYTKINHLSREAAKFVGDFKSLAKEADESLAKHRALELEIERLLKAVVSQDIMSIVQKASIVDTSNLQTELERVDNTKTRMPQPRSNIKNDMVPSASTSSCNKNKGVKVEEHHRNLLLSENKKHMSSACNNIKLDSQNVISKVVYAMCKQCLISGNHDEKQKKQQPKGKKTKKLGFIKRLATPKPSKPRFFLRWSPTGRLFDLKGKIIESSEPKSQSDCSNGDNACSKHMTRNLKLLINFVWKFMGTVRFRNDHVAAIMGFGDL
nr:integrase, catalytic region, zinc finger, CCHC-type, peptidase aspartic, catalytic [Tanacetum cinerariifolium]